MEEGQWRRVVELRLQFIIALKLHQLHLQGADEVADMMIGDITLLTTGDGIIRISYLCPLKIW